MCNCNKNKNGTPATFVVRMANGTTKEVASEAEARSLVRINGGSYRKA